MFLNENDDYPEVDKNDFKSKLEQLIWPETFNVNLSLLRPSNNLIVLEIHSKFKLDCAKIIRVMDFVKNYFMNDLVNLISIESKYLKPE